MTDPVASTTRGVGAAKRLVAGYLAAELPAYLADLRIAWGRDAETLPDPVAYLHNEPKTLDRWPLVAVAGADRTTRRSEQSPRVVTYDATYQLRAFVWVNERGWDQAIDVRDDLTAAVATFLMDRVRVGSDGAAVVQDGLTESYSDVQPVKGDRHVAGAYIGFQLKVSEAIVRPPAGSADTVTLDADLLPVHPALT
jgi:hypothetical protein